jgi:hypothetical protein
MEQLTKEQAIDNFIDIDKTFNLPDYSLKLLEIDENIIFLKEKLNFYLKCHNLTKITYSDLYQEILNVLYFTGKLSTPAYNVRDELKELYFKTYRSSPALAKDMFLKHFEYIHRNYDLMKDKCFRLLDKLNNEYKNIILIDKQKKKLKQTL